MGLVCSSTDSKSPLSNEYCILNMYTCILYIYKLYVLSLCAVFIRQIYTMNIVQCTNAQWTMFNVHCSYICLMNTVHVWSTFMYLSEYSFWEMLCINVFLIFCLLYIYCNLVNVHTLYVLSNNYCILQLLYMRQMYICPLSAINPADAVHFGTNLHIQPVI